MLGFSRPKLNLRGVVGFAVSLTLAIQMVLASIIATQMAVAAPASPFEICYGSGNGQSTDTHDKTSTHLNHATCVVCGFASLSAPVPPLCATVVFRTDVVAAYAFETAAYAATEKQHNPRSSQGPPQIA